MGLYIILIAWWNNPYWYIMIMINDTFLTACHRWQCTISRVQTYIEIFILDSLRFALGRPLSFLLGSEFCQSLFHFLHNMRGSHWSERFDKQLSAVEVANVSCQTCVDVCCVYFRPPNFCSSTEEHGKWRPKSQFPRKRVILLGYRNTNVSIEPLFFPCVWQMF